MLSERQKILLKIGLVLGVFELLLLDWIVIEAFLLANGISFTQLLDFHAYAELHVPVLTPAFLLGKLLEYHLFLLSCLMLLFIIVLVILFFLFW